MDLREKKTRRSLHNAFLELRSRKALERITVKELCERAEISKATFYLHYRDIYDLSDSLQMEVIRNIVQNIKHPEEIVRDARQVRHEMIEAFYANIGLVMILFSGSQFSRMPERIESEIKALVFEKLPELQNDIITNVRITYQVMGGFYAFNKYGKEFGFDAVHQAIDSLEPPEK